MEVATEYPDAHVIGLDISLICQPSIPKNCEFTVGDLTKDLVRYEDDSLDLVHSRYIFRN